MSKTVSKQKALMERFSAAGDFINAKKAGMLLLKTTPRDASVLAELAYYGFRLGNHREAVRWGLKAIAIEPHNIPALIALASAHGALDDREGTRKYGHRVLAMRDREIARLGPAPALGSPRAGTKKLVAFSLFGASPKYCEPAVINAERLPALYPGWTGRFYVDGTVPERITARLAGAGAETVPVEGLLSHWPGPMWRFAAADDPEASHVVFRDADSIVSEREAGAVREWMESGRRFHVMRDAPTHTSLMLAGMWGLVAGALPDLSALAETFLDARAPGWRQHRVPTNHETRALDQRFLAIHVWPFARQDMLHHDSVFGLAEHREFPDGPRHRSQNVGNCESNARFRITLEGRDEMPINWKIFSTENGAERLVCEYDDVVRNGGLWIHLPLDYVHKIQEGKMVVRVTSKP